ncbi:MAG TPA: hypothetical protein VFZ83_05945 [Acidimicrobiia bacterium]|nr:hypothetical protein [Acidimicrobiia bacterium]
MAAVMITTEARAERPLPRATTTRLRLVPPPPARSRRTAAVYFRRRLVAVLLALGIVIVAGRAGGALGGSSLATPESRPSVTTYLVQPGDTLWEIAATLAPERDPREVVDAITDVRGNGPLEVGEQITWLAGE